MTRASGQSALYEGVVWHERMRPFRRSFRTRVWFPYLDLDELPGLLATSRLLDDRRRRPLQFRRSDHHGDPGVPLVDAIRDLVEDRTGTRPDGSVHLLAHLRTWGWCFNPLSLAYCHDADGALRWAVAEVTNTPWKERHTYVLPADADGVRGHEEPKQLHVSPFWPMEQRYRFELSAPGEDLRVRIENVALDGPDAGAVVHVAGLSLRRRPLTDAALARMLIRYPLLTHRVSAGIHRHAAVLAARGARFRPHPRRRTEEVVR